MPPSSSIQGTHQILLKLIDLISLQILISLDHSPLISVARRSSLCVWHLGVLEEHGDTPCFVSAGKKNHEWRNVFGHARPFQGTHVSRSLAGRNDRPMV
jgi:hypothetical protein